MMSVLKSFVRRDYGYSTFHRLFQIVSILGFFALVTVICVQAYTGLTYLGWQTAAWLVPVTLILGYIGSDFASGFVHWLGDTFGHEEMPVLGEGFIKPFREHHVHPKGITEHDFVHVNGNNSIVLALFMTPVMLIFTDPTSTLHILVLASSVSFTVGVFMTNQFHKWAHMDERPAYITRLQRWGLILGPEHHDVHHTSPYDTYYCITCGWLNPILQRTRFFETLEAVIRRVLGVRTSREKAETS